MNSYMRLLLANKSWVQERRAIDPDYFTRFERVQRPDFLWISCSDSRILANELTSTEPGELFVHRNIANLVHPDDENALSVVQYAVEVLGVRHVIVCGHSGCGGVKAALDGDPPGILNSWLRPVRELYLRYRDELDALPELARWDRLVELNTVAQVVSLSQTSIIQDMWARTGRPSLHGWVYSLPSGLLRSLVTKHPGQPPTAD